jgi:hypothetical protein
VLLVSIVEFRLPGAVGRADRRNALAQELCERLSIPPELRRDLDLAVRLEELGHLVAGVSNRDPWRAAQSARSILDSIPGFEGAAELLAEVPSLSGVVMEGEADGRRGRTVVLVGDPVLRHERVPGRPSEGLVRSRPDVFQQANRPDNIPADRRPMKQQDIDVIGFEICEALFDRGQKGFFRVIIRAHFRGDAELSARNAGCCKRDANFSLVAVHLRRIDRTIASLEGGVQCTGKFLTPQRPCAEAALEGLSEVN